MDRKGETSKTFDRVPVGMAGRKAEKVTACAWDMFFEKGFQATSMDAIAREANVSKATLYSYFPSKESLFAHLVASECCAMASKLKAPDLDGGLPEALRSFGKQYVGVYFNRDPKRSAFFHVLASEGSRFPELGRLFVEQGPGVSRAQLAGLLEEADRRGLVTIADVSLAATQFLSLVRGDLPMRLALGCATFEAADLDRHVDAAVTFFLRGYAPVTSAAPREVAQDLASADT